MVSPDELLNFAFEMTGRPDEAALRAAVSRAYYAAFLHCRQSIDQIGTILPGSGQDHRIVVQAVTRMDPFRGRQLQLSRIARNRADYDLTEVVDHFDALAAWLRATVILEF